MSGQGFRINFSVPEIREALDKISAYDGRSAQRIENAVLTSTKNIKSGAQRRVRVRSGGLKKSISSRFDKRSVTGYVAAKKPHAHLLEFGAKSAVVRPEKKKALKIPFRGMGVEMSYFATKAHIPQRRAHPYMRPAFEDEKPNLITGLKEAVRKP